MKEFSIITPTRDRPNQIERLVRSIEKTTNNHDNIEIVFRIDFDDKKSLKSVQSLNSSIHINYFVGERAPLSDLWEDCKDISDGLRLMMCADDVIFRTKEWDNIIISKTPDPDKKPYFIWGNDMHHKHRLATLPIVSKKWVELCGYFVPRGYGRDWCDTHLHDIAKKLKSNGMNVMQYFDNVVFEHLHPLFGKAPYDETYVYRLQLHGDDILFQERSKEREKIAKRMKALFRLEK